MAKCYLYGARGGNDLNFRIKQYESSSILLNSAPPENTIGITSTIPINGYSFSFGEPGLAYKAVDLIDGLEAVAGYWTGNGGNGPQGTPKEVRIETYIPVEYGKTYNWTYSISEANPMWFSIVEYIGTEGNYKVSGQRLTPVSESAPTTSTYHEGTYIPSKSTITAIRISWRTYDIDNTVTFIDPAVPYTTGDIGTGYVWLKLKEDTKPLFNALKKNVLNISLEIVKIYDSEWKNIPAYIYQNKKWQLISSNRVYLINKNDTCATITGGWKEMAWYWNSDAYGHTPDVSWDADGVHVATTGVPGPGGVIVSNNTIDLTPWDNLIINCDSLSGDKIYCEISTANDNNFESSNTIKQQLSAGFNAINISELKDSYYVGIAVYYQQNVIISEVCLE